MRGHSRLSVPRNTVHRHEPPITISPILLLHRDDEKQFIVISKPGSVVSGLVLRNDFEMVTVSRPPDSLLIVFVMPMVTASPRDRKVFQTYDIGAFAF